jgi:hypothetical protein
MLVRYANIILQNRTKLALSKHISNDIEHKKH